MNDEENLLNISNESDDDSFEVNIYLDSTNKLKKKQDIQLVFSDDDLFVYKYNKLIYQILYYNIMSWISGNELWGINYYNSEKEKNKLYFNCDDPIKITNVIKKRTNEILKLKNEGYI